MSVIDETESCGIVMLDDGADTYFSLGVKLTDLSELLAHSKSQDEAFLTNEIARLRFEMDHIPPRLENAIIVDIANLRHERVALREKTYPCSESYIPKDDWMGSCDGSSDYVAFWNRLADQRVIDRIERRDIPLLEEELERTRRMVQ